MTARAIAGRAAIVTGASPGIGRAIAERLAADGAVCASWPRRRTPSGSPRSPPDSVPWEPAWHDRGRRR